MIPAWLTLKTLRALPWRWILLALAAVAFAAWILAAISSYGDRREDAGRAAVQRLWEADTTARNVATDQAIAEARAREDAAKANNTEVMNDANAKLTAIAADRGSLSRLLRSYRDSLRRVTTAEAADQPVVVGGAGVAASPAEVALDDYDQACRRDAVRFEALIAEVKGQL